MILNELSQDIHLHSENDLPMVMYPAELLIENAAEIRQIQESILDSIIDYQYTNIITESETNIFKTIVTKIGSIIDKFISTIRKFFKAVKEKFSKNLYSKTDQELYDMVEKLHLENNKKYKDVQITYNIPPFLNKNEICGIIDDQIQENSCYKHVLGLYHAVTTTLQIANATNDPGSVSYKEAVNHLKDVYDDIQQILKSKPSCSESIDNIDEYLVIGTSSSQEHTSSLLEAKEMAKKCENGAISMTCIIGLSTFESEIDHLVFYKKQAFKLYAQLSNVTLDNEINSLAIKVLEITLSIINDTINRCQRIAQHVTDVCSTNISIYKGFTRSIYQSIIHGAKNR